MQLSPGAHVLRRRMSRAAARAFQPSSRLSGSEWTEGHLHLDRIGLWRWESAPYMRGIQDSLCDPKVPRVVLQKGSQIGGTTGGIVAMLGYAVHQRPTRVLVYFPSEGDAKKFSRDKLDPAFRQSPELRGSFTYDSLFEKRYAGGMIFIQSGGTPRTFRQTDAEWAVLDDLDGFEDEVGEEGGPVGLAENRLKAYRRGKLAAVSTPTIRDFSLIEDLFGESDGRRFHVPCPHCKTRQVLRWGGPDKDYGFKWDMEEGPNGELAPVLDSVAYLCASCGTLIDEKHKAWMVRTAAEKYENHGWIPERPERSAESHGYHLPQFISLFPGASWRSILKQWYGAREDPAKLKTVVNQVFAETWEERGEKLTSATLEARAEEYTDLDGEVVDVPDGVGVLTAGVDVQGDRLELLVCGWGVGEESWDILHERIYGDPEAAHTWARLDGLLTRQYTRASGRPMRILAAMVDAGYKTDAVYQFVKPRESRNVWAAMGDNGAEKNPPLRRPTRSNNAGVKVFTTGVWELKDTLFKSLRIARPGPRHIHLRTANPDRCNGFDAEYFAQFEGEKLVTEIVRGSRRPRRIFKQVRKRNEAIDLRVLNHAALMALGGGVREKMAAWVEAARKPAEEVEAQRKASKAPRRRKNWATDWK